MISPFFITIFAIMVSNFSLSKNSNHSLLVIKKEKDSCSFLVQSIEQSKTEKWFNLSNCLSATENLIFESDKRRAFILQDNKYLTVEIKKNSKPTIFSDAYMLHSEKNIVKSKTWIDKNSGSLRVALLIEIPIGLKDSSEIDWVRKSFPVLEKLWVSNHEEESGVPSIAIVAELDKNGKWKELAVKQTTSQAEGAAGLSVVSSFIQQKDEVYSLQDLLMKATCSNKNCLENPPHFSKKTSRWVKEKFKSNDESNSANYSYIPMSEYDGFIAAVAFGDSLHWVKPLFYCKGNSKTPCETYEEIPYSEEQISISPQFNYVLISKEYDGTSAMLFKSGSKQPVSNYTSDSVVVWFPSNIAW